MFFIFIFFLRFFCEILQRRSFEHGVQHVCFFLFSPQDVNKQFMCPANPVIYTIKGTMNPHKEKIIINRNISEIPYNIYLFFRPPSLALIYYLLLLSLDLCTHYIMFVLLADYPYATDNNNIC